MSDAQLPPGFIEGTKETFGSLAVKPSPVAPVAVAAPVEKNPAAVAMGGLSKGRPKTLTPEERDRRREHARSMTAKRVAKRASSSVAAEPPVVTPAPSSTAVTVSKGVVKRPMVYHSKGKVRRPEPVARTVTIRG